MAQLELEFALRGRLSPERLARFCTRLARAVRAGAFAWPDDIGGWSQVEAETLSGSVSSGMTLTVPLPDGATVSMPALRSVFKAPVELAQACAEVLVALRGPGVSRAAELLESRLASWERSGRMDLPVTWPLGEPVTVAIEFDSVVSPQAQLAWRDDLDALEEVVADAPFLGCDEGRYASVGESQVHWLGPSLVHYWVAGVATQAPWPALLCSQLFAPTGPAPARALRIVR